MIARLWHGITKETDADAFLNYLHQTGIPDYRSSPGNKGVHVLRRMEGKQVHFMLISFWESREVLKEFLGADWERARYYPRDKGFLLELEPTVTHYDVLTAPDWRVGLNPTLI